MIISKVSKVLIDWNAYLIKLTNQGYLDYFSEFVLIFTVIQNTGEIR